MNIQRITTVSIILSMMVLFSSCSHRLIDFTVISSKSHQIQFDRGDAKQTEGSSVQFLAIGVNIKDAVDDALENAGPEYDILIDGVLRQVNYFFAGGFRVEGLAVNSSELRSQMGEEEFNNWLEGQENVYNPEEIEESEIDVKKDN